MSNHTVEPHPTLSRAACFPLARLAKTPAVKWQSFEGPLPDGTRGYGVDCERSGLVVIDLDRHSEDADGLLTWQKLLEDNGGSLGDTFSVSTPNGGLHLYYLASDETDVRNSAGKLGPGVDVRAKGGYVVGPHSVIKTADGFEGAYEVARDEIIQELPAWLLDLLSPAKKGDTPTPLPVSTDDFPDNYARKALESAYYIVSTAPSGQRNDVLNREAYGAAKAGAPVARVVADLTRAALANGLTRKEADGTVARAAAEGAAAYIPRSAYSPTASTLSEGAAVDMEFKRFTKEFYLDYALGERWAQSKSGDLRYVVESGHWLRYEDDRGIWIQLPESSVRQDAANWLRREYNSAVLRSNDGITKNAERCLSKATADHTIYMGKLHLLTNSANLDKHRDLLVVANGVVHLPTSELRPFDRDLLITKAVEYPYDPTISSSYWSKVLEALPADAHEWLQLMTGQTLTGHQTASDVCMFLFGGGSNGKSTFLDLLAASAGDYGDEPPQSSLERKVGHGEDYGLIMFKAIRQALVEELPDERNLDAKAIKKLVGTKTLTARALYRDYETFPVLATLWVSCNRLPNVSETDTGTWRRLLVVPFPYTYRKTAAEVIEAADRLADPLVKNHASTDAATIAACLAWRIEGARRWYGNKGLEAHVPQSVEQASLNWRKRSNHLLAWAEDKLVADPTSYVLSMDLRDSFNLYLRENGYPGWGSKLFLERFETSDFFTSSKLVYNPKSTVAKGIRQSQWAPPEGEARIAGKQPAHMLGVRFRTSADDDRELAATITMPDDASEPTDEQAFADDNELFDDETVF